MFTARRKFQLTVASAAVLAMLLLGACDWTQFRYGPEHTGFNPTETTIGPANVSALHLRWSQSVVSHPAAVANGVLYAVGSGRVYAFDANTGSARWSSEAIGSQLSAAVVVNGVVYVTTESGLDAL